MPYDEPLTLAVCPSCGLPVHRMKVGGIETTADLAALGPAEAVAARIAGRRLYRITFVGGRPLSMRPVDNLVLTKLADAPPEERPHVVAGHPCAAVSRPLTPSPGSGAGGPGKGPQTGAQGFVPSSTPSPAPDAPAAPARTAARLRSDAPRCDACGKPCADGTYASVSLGELTVWAEHVQEGGCTPA